MLISPPALPALRSPRAHRAIDALAQAPADASRGLTAHGNYVGY